MLVLNVFKLCKWQIWNSDYHTINGLIYQQLTVKSHIHIPYITRAASIIIEIGMGPSINDVMQICIILPLSLPIVTN